MGRSYRIAAPGSLPSFRESLLLNRRAAAYLRTGDVETAKRLAAELNARFPFETWRARSPDVPDSETERNRYRSIQEALKAAGGRDHLDPDADFGVASDTVLHENLEGETPTTAPGVTTVNTEQLASMLNTQKPLVIDTMDASWYRSIPGAVGLDISRNTHGTFTDAVQKRLKQKLRALTGDDMAKPIVAMAFNVARFDGYNLALACATPARRISGVAFNRTVTAGQISAPLVCSRKRNAAMTSRNKLRRLPQAQHGPAQASRLPCRLQCQP